jgi:uncharacterized protein (DUF433 family)
MAVQPNHHIEQTPGICGGKPRIAGHRIRVQDIAIWYEHLGMTADEIVSEHPDITLADVHAALSYYYDHRAEIQEDIRASDALVAELRAKTPSKLRQRLTEIENDGDSLSSR